LLIIAQEASFGPLTAGRSDVLGRVVVLLCKEGP